MENIINSIILEKASSVRRNLSSDELYEIAHTTNEGKLSKHGALVVNTGKHTGRSANDKFFVKEARNEKKIHWGDTNVPISEENFEKILKSFIDYAQEKDLFIHDLLGGADRDNCLGVSIITEYAWHGLFARHLLVRPTKDELKNVLKNILIENYSAKPKKNFRNHSLNLLSNLLNTASVTEALPSLYC